TICTVPLYSSSSSPNPLMAFSSSGRPGRPCLPGMCSCGDPATGTIHAKVVVVGIEPAGAQGEVPGESGPQSGVATLLVEVPAVAATGHPDSALHGPVDHVVVATLCLGPYVDPVQAVPAQVLEGLHGVSDLCLDHEHLRGVTEAGVGPGEDEYVGETGHGGATEGQSVGAPVIDEGTAVGDEDEPGHGRYGEDEYVGETGHGGATEGLGVGAPVVGEGTAVGVEDAPGHGRLGDVEAGAEDDGVDLVLGLHARGVPGHDRVRPDLDDAVRDHVHVGFGQRRVVVVGHQDTFAPGPEVRGDL